MRNGKICIGFYESTTSVAVGMLSEGFLLNGYEIERRDVNHFNTQKTEQHLFDYVVVHGLRGKFGECAKAYKNLGIPVLVFDFGYIDRVNNLDDYYDKYWYLGFDGFGWRPEFDCAGDRLSKLSQKVDYRKGKASNRIVICGQMPNDASHGMSDGALASYYRKIFSQLKLKSNGKYKITYRPHPRAKSFIPIDSVVIEDETLEECLSNAHAVFVYNSTVGLDALIRGCPVICDGDAFYKQYVNRWECELDNLIVPDKSEVEKICRQLSYAQWKLDECKAGLPAAFLKRSRLIRQPNVG